MAKLQNLFLSGILDTDNNRRLVNSNTLVDAENFVVVTTENSNRGVGRNVPGNIKITSNNFTSPEVLGSRANNSKEKIYYFVKTATTDYIVEFNYLTKANAIVLQSSTGSRLNFKPGERIINIDIIYSGEPYNSETQQGGDLLAWSGDTNPPRIGNIERMKTWGLDGFTSEEIMLIKAPPLNNALVIMLTTSNPAGQQENYLRDKFISFAYRYKYKDGYYSAISSWQQYSFSPDKFKLNFVTMENDGMINIFNAANIFFNSGPREVIAIDLLFKKSNESTVYKVDQFIKVDEGWADNTVVGPIQFNNSKIYSVLPQEQYFRSFDNVPEQSYSQTIIGNRIAFANYFENKNLVHNKGLQFDNGKTVMNYTVDFVASDGDEAEYPATKSDTNPQLIVPPPTVPFVTANVENGKISIDFTGSTLNKDSILSVFFNLTTLPVDPQLVPERDITLFINPYVFTLTQDYANIQALVNDVANGFRTNLETNGYFSNAARTILAGPIDNLNNALGFPPSYYHGFTLTVISANVIEISFPIIKWEIEVLPAGPNYYVEEFYSDVSTQVVVSGASSQKSMKSYRSYEIAMIYRDLQGRKTTALTSEFSTVFIPIANSITSNKITVNIPTTQKPPYWATTYKFAIRENKGFYSTIYATTFYVDGEFVWVKLQGTSLNKVKKGDTLLVKRDVFDYVLLPVTTKVLELKEQPKDFITGNQDNQGQEISEEAGTYMQLKPEGYHIEYTGDEFKTFTFDERSHSEVYALIDNLPAISSGSVVTFTIHCAYRSGEEVNDYSHSFVASSDYLTFEAFFMAQLDSVAFQGTNPGTRNGGIFEKHMNSATQLHIQGTSAGTGQHHAFLNGRIVIRSVSGVVIFETMPEDTDNHIFYETPDIFNIVDGEHVINALDLANELSVVNGVHTLERTFNCFTQGNGAESNQILDGFNNKYINIDFLATAVSENEYRQINRFADITYSETFNTNTSVNRLNEFNLSLANFKDDIEKVYGPIIKMKGLDTNLDVFQEDKDSIVYYGKDLLYNADGTTNLTGVPQVLGEQKTYEGEYGISSHPESYARYGFDTYHTDVKRGVVIKKSNNGLFEISSQGMTNYFKNLFKNTTILNIIGEYDQLNDLYVLNIKYIENSVTKYVTWFYSDTFNGWCLRQTFDPMDMCALNNNFLSFSQGEMYEHNKPFNGLLPNYNVFYGVEHQSKFEFYFSQNPSERKIYSVLEIEGTTPLTISTETDLNKGYINSVDFEKKEGVFYAYIRNSNDTIDSSLLSCQGIGNATISTLTLVFAFDLDPIISIGDKIVNINKLLVGTILSKTKNTLTLDTVNNIISGDYVICAKTQSIAVNSMLGYYMGVKASFNSTSEQEVFAINSEVIKSNP